MPKWCLPPPGSYKLNFDACVLGNPRLAGVEGLFTIQVHQIYASRVLLVSSGSKQGDDDVDWTLRGSQTPPCPSYTRR